MFDEYPAIVRTIAFLGFEGELTQSVIQKKLGIAKESTSKILSELETLHYISNTGTKPLENSPGRPGKVWEITFLGLITLTSWLVQEYDQLVDKLAELNKNKWLIFREWVHISKNPLIKKYITLNIKNYHPQNYAIEPRLFMATYKSQALHQLIYKKQSNEIIYDEVFRELTLQTENSRDRYTSKVIGFSEYMETLLTTQRNQKLVEHLLEKQSFRDFYLLQIENEEKKIATLAMLKEKINDMNTQTPIFTE